MKFAKQQKKKKKTRSNVILTLDRLSDSGADRQTDKQRDGERDGHLDYNDRWNNFPHYTQTENDGRGPCEPSLVNMSTTPSFP